MLVRVLAACIGIPLFLALCIWGKEPFSIGVLIIAILGLVEMLMTFRASGRSPNLFVASLGPLGPAASIAFERGKLYAFIALDPLAPWLAVGAAGFLMGTFWEIARSARTGEMRAGQNLGLGLLIGAYVALFCGLSALRNVMGTIPNVISAQCETGAALVIVTAVSVWATDSFAYFTGSALGRHKMAPMISPGKTWEGAFGGFFAGLIVGAGFGAWLLHSWSFGLAIGATAGVFGQIGDLFESALKREIGVKDFGGIMPGHGGVLDRFDSLLFVAPIVAFLCFYFPISQ